MISETNRHMLALLADVLHNRTPGKILPEEWPAIRKELHAQSVYALPSSRLFDLGLSPQEAEDFLRAAAKNRVVFLTLMQEQKKLLALLESAGIPVVILKGAAAAMYYLHPEDRCMGDIDILVLPRDFQRTFDVLTAAGYTTEQSPEDAHRHIGLHSENGASIELHNYFSHSSDAVWNETLDAMLYAAIPHRVRDNLNGFPVTHLPEAENGLVLLSHINQHLPTGLGLRQIIDWMYYAEKNLDDEFWENRFAPMAERIGMKRLAVVTTAMCRKYLGLDKDIHWCPEEPVCDELMEYILEQGNFGKKIRRKDSLTVNVLEKFRTPFHGFAAAQSIGLGSWKACRKHRWLRPFAWAYQMLHWLRSGLKRRVSIKTLRASASSARDLTELLDKLGVSRV